MRAKILPQKGMRRASSYEKVWVSTSTDITSAVQEIRQTNLKVKQQDDAIYQAVARARRDPIWFRKNILLMKNDPWQDEILQAFMDIFRFQRNEPTVVNHEGLRRFSVRSGHGPGKTNVIAETMHLCGFTRKSQMICTATKFKQVTTRLWPTFRTIMNHAIDDYRSLIQMKQHKITWAGDPDWYAMPETATTPENMQGAHPLSEKDFLLILIDEASGVKQKIFEVLSGTLSKPNAALFMIGNPTQNQGEFYESHNKPGVKKYYYTRHVKPEESSHMDKQWYQEGLERYGANSPIFLVRYRGEFAENADNQLIPLAWLLAAMEREPIDDGSLPHLRVVVDVADGGVDETVIDAARMYDTHTVFLKQERHSFPSSESPVLAADYAEKLFLSLGGRKEEDDFVVDSLGVGAGTAGTLMARGYRVVCYKGGESSSNPEIWRNRRVQSYMVLRDELAAGRVSFAEDYASEQDCDDMMAQVCWIRSKPGIERVEDLETKQELIRDSGKSPDLADTKAMMYATQSPSTGSILLTGGVVATSPDSEGAHASW